MNDRDAEQPAALSGRQTPVGGSRACERLLGGERDQGIQTRVEALDSSQKMPRELDA